MPIHNSGCRYFGRLTAVLGMTPCYLRTYTWLLQQHQRMLGIARAVEERGAKLGLVSLHSDSDEASKANATTHAWTAASEMIALHGPKGRTCGRRATVAQADAWSMELVNFAARLKRNARTFAR